MTLGGVTPPPPSRSGKGWILALILLAGVLVSASLLIRHWRPYGEPQRFVVARGASVRQIIGDLTRVGLIRSPKLFRLWMRLDGGSLRPGIYTLSPSWTGRSIYQALRRGPPMAKVTFPEGWTSRQMADLLESKGIVDRQAFLDAVAQQQKEGFLFPDTYFFEQGSSPDMVIAHMVKRFHEKEPKDMEAQGKALNLTYRQIVTLASIVEREAQAPQERAVIAGVFYNRLRKHWRLESCATVEYALGKWKPQLRYKDLEINSPYNTYRHEGLPPGPIGNPGAAALEAAAHPAKTDMMFFVADGHGTHRFTKYYKEHLAVQGVKKK